VSYKNHLKIGSTTVRHKGQLAVCSLNSLEFRNFIKSLDNQTYQVGTIPPGYEHRADKISNLFYETPDLDWLICWSNNISDPFQQLNVGDRVKIIDL
jgi:hypothetical protein